MVAGALVVLLSILAVGVVVALVTAGTAALWPVAVADAQVVVLVVAVFLKATAVGNLTFET